MSAFNIVSWEQVEPVEAYPMSSFLTDLALPDEGDRDLLKEAEALASRRFSFQDRLSSSAESSLEDDEDYFEYDDLLDAAADLWDGRNGSGTSSPDSFSLGYHIDAPESSKGVPAIAVKDVDLPTSPKMLRNRSSIQSFADAFAPRRGGDDASSRRKSDSGGSAADDEGEDEGDSVSRLASPSLTDNSDLHEAEHDRPRILLRPASSMARSATSPVPSTPGSIYSTLSPGPQQFRPLLSPAPLDDALLPVEEAEQAQSRRISVLFREVESLTMDGARATVARPLSLGLPSPTPTSMSRTLSLASSSTSRHTYVRSSTVREAMPHRRPQFQAAPPTSVALERSASKKGSLSSRFVALRKSLPSLAAARAAAEARESRPRLTSDMISQPIPRADSAESVAEEETRSAPSDTEVDSRSQPMSQELLAILAGQNGGDLWDDESDDESGDDEEEETADDA